MGGMTAARSLRVVSTPPLGVRIWSGPSADRLDTNSPVLPSISESPLEQDFTIEGKPSRLGCPFASMANKKLSSHAASVLSRYNTTGSEQAASTAMSSVSRVNGKDSISRRESRRASFADPAQHDVCGLSSRPDCEQLPEHVIEDHVQDPASAEPGVCPIRYLDQHSPEEVATYFEKHKHELPRSHEFCVKRYQSNEEQIRELDAKYGSLVSMIQGLGAKHKDMLPDEPDDVTAADAGEDSKSAEKVRKWASSVSAQHTGDEEDAPLPQADDDDRRSHFERPLRDIRVGESPSRPWGISVPIKYLDKAASEASTKPAHVPSSPALVDAVRPASTAAEAPKGKCPFDFGRAPKAAVAEKQAPVSQPQAQPVFVMPELGDRAEASPPSINAKSNMTFTGPVFIGYSADDAAKILRESGWAGR